MNNFEYRTFSVMLCRPIKVLKQQRVGFIVEELAVQWQRLVK